MKKSEIAFCLWLFCFPTILVSAENFQPTDANLPNQQIIFATPNQNTYFNTLALTAWINSATLEPGIRNDGTVVLDYIKIIEYDPQTDVEHVAYLEHYNGYEGQLNTNQGGLYQRIPYWFATDNHTAMTNSVISGGLLNIAVGAQPDSLSHWWTARVSCQPNCRYYIEIKIKISSGIGVQVGLDFWRSFDAAWNGLNVNNTESWHSNWLGDTNGQFVTIRTPITFLRNQDYGVTTSGKIFISEDMVSFLGGSNVMVNSEITGWLMQNMVYENGLYSYQSADSLTSPVLYCFHIDSGWIPPLGANALVFPDTVANGLGGYNLRTLPTSQIIMPTSLPEEFPQLYQNYPNPFNQETKIGYYLPDVSRVSLVIYNLRGQQIRQLVNQYQGGGLHTVSWTGDNMPSGVYIYLLKTDWGKLAKRMLLLK